jgi:hypothetical protein
MINVGIVGITSKLHRKPYTTQAYCIIYAERSVGISPCLSRT